MRQDAQGRLSRLERRQPRDADADLNEAELLGRIDGILAKLADAFGRERARDVIAREFKPGTLDMVDQMTAAGRLRGI